MDKIDSLKKEVEKRVRDILAEGIVIESIAIYYIKRGDFAPDTKEILEGNTEIDIKISATL